MMAGTAGFDPDHRWRELLEERHHLVTPELFAQNRDTGVIHPMKLKNVLRRIHSNSANLVHDGLLCLRSTHDLILAHSMPPGAVHTNRICRFRVTRARENRRPVRAGFSSKVVLWGGDQPPRFRRVGAGVARGPAA